LHKLCVCVCVCVFFLVYIYFGGRHNSPKKKKGISFWLIRPITPTASSPLACVYKKQTCSGRKPTSSVLRENCELSSLVNCSCRRHHHHLSLCVSNFEFLCFIPATKRQWWNTVEALTATAELPAPAHQATASKNLGAWCGRRTNLRCLVWSSVTDGSILLCFGIFLFPILFLLRTFFFFSHYLFAADQRLCWIDHGFFIGLSFYFYLFFGRGRCCAW
jgi:hypothetical protein